MKNTREIGNYGEDLAEKYLKKRFWRIISRNFSANGGEIDIIAYRFGKLTFFEVKTRSNDKYGLPHESVDGRKISRIRKASYAFLRLYGTGGRVPVFYPFGIEINRRIRKTSIDVIEVYLSKEGNSPRINHIKDWDKQL